MNNEDYDVKGRVHLLQQRRIRSFDSDIADRPDFGSFDVEFTPTGQVQLETRYTYSRNIFRSTRFLYDEAQREIRSIELDQSGLEKTIYEYSYPEGRCLWTSRDAKGIVTSRGTEEYDDACLTSSVTYDGSGQITHLSSYEYKDGKLLKKVSKYCDRGEPYEICISHFDALGRVAEAYGLTPNGKPIGDGRYTFEYDEEGRKVKVLSYNDWSDTNIPNHISHFTYTCDGHGNWVERNEYSRWRDDTDWKRYQTTRTLSYYPASEL